MSNFLRRASDALHHPRKGSQDEPVNPDSANPPTAETQAPQDAQEPLGPNAAPEFQRESQPEDKDKAGSSFLS
ncbi:uncharacterized protein N7482_007082 [Penicillium canariense]|uniref:Uncharacterized protein n=1 Tax=Penicillium canariense TaxID=189055 RepID=A0A9W9HYC9_9EURO|nr:uncharacterized protein N7482_007082 [Penicillium canariense]KAJ5160078.1 hypothetical protein N7482_007082 [Penicillium canariense]